MSTQFLIFLFLFFFSLNTIDAWNRQHKSNTLSPKKTNFISDKPRLHRRKPHPWNVHRSLKKDFVQKNNITLEEHIPLGGSRYVCESDDDLKYETPSMSNFTNLRQVACSIEQDEPNHDSYFSC